MSAPLQMFVPRETAAVSLGADEVADRIAALGHIYGCNGCEAAIAREFGATAYVTALIHKVSTLILSITIRVHDSETGAVTRVGSADIRGDNDRAWSHGVRWLLRNRILAD